MNGWRLPRWRRVAAVAAAVLVAMWCGGLIAFVRAIPTTLDDPGTVTDAIVVLTGGSLRVESGLELLAAGKAKKLFISGVYHGVEVGDLLRLSRQSPDWVACCIMLGHAAESTRGNALETASWMRAQSFHSLRLVTANYHMPRSLLEFSRAMPGVAIVPHPVFPELSRDAGWWAKPASVGLVLVEYDKYLAALVRPLVPIRLLPARGDAG